MGEVDGGVVPSSSISSGIASQLALKSVQQGTSINYLSEEC